MNEEEKKVIEELNKKAVFCNYEERDYPNMICFKKDMLIVLKLIEKLRKENEELKEGIIPSYEETISELEKQLFESIPAQKIKDKIEELKEEKEEYYSREKIEELDDKIQVLQELLENKN